MYGQPPTSAAQQRQAVERAAEAATLGLGPRLDRNGTRALVACVESDPDARVCERRARRTRTRAPKVSARAAWKRATHDRDPSVRRRTAELAPLLDTPTTRATMITSVLALLADDDPLVAEAAAFALGELARRVATAPVRRAALRRVSASRA